MTEENPLSVIGELLAGRARPTINVSRVAPSSIYDLQYRVAVISSAIHIHAKERPVDAGVKRVQAARLKLLQFAASRPRLIPIIREWSEAQGDAQLSLGISYRLRKGYLSDRMHDNVISFLIARGDIVSSGQYVTARWKGAFLSTLHEENVKLQLFNAERFALESLSKIKITNAMLEGW